MAGTCKRSVERLCVVRTWTGALVFLLANLHNREFSVYVETHTSLFHPDHHLTVVKGGREEVREVDTRRIVLGQIEGNIHHHTLKLECFLDFKVIASLCCIGEKGSVVHGVIVDGVLEGVIYSRG